jgi:hypothetical protein
MLALRQRRKRAREDEEKGVAVSSRVAADGRAYNIDDDDIESESHEFMQRGYSGMGIAGRPARPMSIFRLEDSDIAEPDILMFNRPSSSSDRDNENDGDDEKHENTSTGNVRKWNASFELIKKYYAEKRKAWIASKQLRPREELSTDDLRDISSGEGDRRLANVYRCLEAFPVVRVAYQKLFHDYIIKSALPKIYQGEWEHAQVRVLKQYGLDKIDYEILITTARRMGKTWAISMITAAMLLNVPGLRVIIVSTGGRASSSLTETVIKFIEYTKGGKERIIKRNQEALFLAPPGYENLSKEQKRKQLSSDTTSRLFSFPSNSTGKHIDTRDAQGQERDRKGKRGGKHYSAILSNQIKVIIQYWLRLFHTML